MPDLQYTITRPAGSSSALCLGLAGSATNSSTPLGTCTAPLMCCSHSTGSLTSSSTAFPEATSSEASFGETCSIWALASPTISAAVVVMAFFP